MDYTDEQREARKLRQDACEHPAKQLYPLTASDYILCCGCGLQFPMGANSP